MDRPALVALALPVLLLTGGCADARESASTVRDCAGLAADVARTGLSGVPTPDEAEQALQRLDDRLQDVESSTVREAATELRDRLSDLQEAAGNADPAAATRAAQDAREAARAAAEACDLPADQFLGG